jgi:hypothetical protein
MFSYNIPLEYANRVFDLFWLFDEKFLVDCIIHLLKLKKERLKKMQMEVRVNINSLGVIHLYQT